MKPKLRSSGSGPDYHYTCTRRFLHVYAPDIDAARRMAAGSLPLRRVIERAALRTHYVFALRTLYNEVRAAGLKFIGADLDMFLADTAEARAILERHPLDARNTLISSNHPAPGEWLLIPSALYNA